MSVTPTGIEALRTGGATEILARSSARRWNCSLAHHRERMSRHEAQTDDAQQSQQAQQATGTELDEFNKAISVCLVGSDSLAQN